MAVDGLLVPTRLQLWINGGVNNCKPQCYFIAIATIRSERHAYLHWPHLDGLHKEIIYIALDI